MQDSKFADFSNFSSFSFKVSHVFTEEKDNPVEKAVIDVEKLDGIEIDGILNLRIQIIQNLLNIFFSNSKMFDLRSLKCVKFKRVN